MHADQEELRKTNALDFQRMQETCCWTNLSNSWIVCSDWTFFRGQSRAASQHRETGRSIRKEFLEIVKTLLAVEDVQLPRVETSRVTDEA